MLFSRAPLGLRQWLKTPGGARGWGWGEERRRHCSLEWGAGLQPGAQCAGRRVRGPSSCAECEEGAGVFVPSMLLRVSSLQGWGGRWGEGAKCDLYISVVHMKILCALLFSRGQVGFAALRSFL